MGLDCSKIDEWGTDPIHESPAAYVADMRKRIQMNALTSISEEQIKDTEDMNADELRKYYDRLGKKKLKGMDKAS